MKSLSEMGRLPSWFKESARVDLAQLVAGVRPAVRTKLGREVPRRLVQRWGQDYEWFVEVDVDNYMAVSGSISLSRRVLAIDREAGEHTYRLGQLLGYPECCCRAAAKVGEGQLDSWAAGVCARGFWGPFGAMDPSYYARGYSLISHVPCSANCLPSLRMALSLLVALLDDRLATSHYVAVGSDVASQIRGMSGELGSDVCGWNRLIRWAWSRCSGSIGK